MHKGTPIFVMITLLIFVSMILIPLVGCQDNSGAAPAVPPSGSATFNSFGTSTPVTTPTPSPVPPESLTYKQKKDMVWSGTSNLFGQIPARIYIFYIEFNGAGKMIWAEKPFNPGSGGFDLFDVFNGEFLFHVSIPLEDEAKVTPSDFPKYIDEINETIRQYEIVAAGKLLDISDIYLNNKIDFLKIGDPYEVLISHFQKTPSSFNVSSKDELLDAFIEVTPAQYILPFWEYIPNAVTPYSYFNPLSPTPILTPTPALTPMPDDLKQLLLWNGINSNAHEVGQIFVYNYELKGNKYRCWVFEVINKEKSIESNGCKVIDVFDIFTTGYLFSLSLPNNGIDQNGQRFSISQAATFLSETNPALDGMSIKHASSLCGLAYDYKIWEIDYNNEEFLNELSEPFYSSYTPEVENELERRRQMVLPMDFMKDVFLNSTPHEEIMPFWVYFPGAQIPEELKGIYSEADYPPAPAE